MNFADEIYIMSFSFSSYTGYVPQFRYRVGKTFGELTHKLFIDPCVTHGEKLIVSDNVHGDGKSKLGMSPRKSCEELRAELTGRIVIDCREPKKPTAKPAETSPYHFSLFVLRPEFAAKDKVTPSQLPKFSNGSKGQIRNRRGELNSFPARFFCLMDFVYCRKCTLFDQYLNIPFFHILLARCGGMYVVVHCSGSIFGQKFSFSKSVECEVLNVIRKKLVRLNEFPNNQSF
jgi:Protein of unknown function (DUF2475)